MHRLCGDYLAQKTAKDGTPVEVAYAFQDFSSIPDFYPIPADRTKPFGTVHALLCAVDVVHEPFCVINADDYYGMDAYQTAYDALQTMPEAGKAAMVGYLLKNTASLYGSVTRGICTVENGMLRAVKENAADQTLPGWPSGERHGAENAGPGAIVSMNFWCFMPSIFPVLREYFENFLKNTAGDDLKVECLLPIMVDDLMKQNRLEVSVLHSRISGLV